MVRTKLCAGKRQRFVVHDCCERSACRIRSRHDLCSSSAGSRVILDGNRLPPFPFAPRFKVETLMPSLLELIYAPRSRWNADARTAFSDALQERYLRVMNLTDKRNEEKRFQLRLNADASDGAVPYAALIAPDQDLSGGYGGMSVVAFPSDSDDGGPAIIGMVVGTNGLAPDEAILGRPGHARKCAAIAAALNRRHSGCAWAKHDPVRIDMELPKAVASQLESWQGPVKKYGRVLYATFVPPSARTVESDALVLDALWSFIDLFFDERGIAPKKPFQPSAARLRTAWLSCILPSIAPTQVKRLLDDRRFVIVEGPPGTGKTEMAESLLRDSFGGRGRVIQFHPGTTYETFIGGLSPQDGGTLGFTFRPSPGHLMEAAREAAAKPGEPYLLVIDEINRADLAKVLGEAIYLFEPGRESREVTLQHHYADTGRTLRLPPNLYVLGTMNSADRSIAILDLAVRRRFSFVQLWPQLSVVKQHAGDTLAQAFEDLLMLFVEHATDDALSLVPGHAYFLGQDDEAVSRLSTGVRPLLEEYLSQGYVSGFAEEIRAFLSRHVQEA